VIAGGGPAGAAAAITLARQGHEVLLVDDSAGGFRLGEALAPAARPVLRELGVLERFEADGHLPCYGNVSAWGSSEAYCTDFIFNPHGHGWHLDRARFDAMLRQEAQARGATFLTGARLTREEEHKRGWRVTLRIGGDSARWEEVRSAWMIDATGRRAAVAQRLGARRVHEDHLIACYTRFRPGDSASADEDSRTFVEAAPDGWWYTALIPSGERVVGFLTDRDFADRAALHSATGFMHLLQETQLIWRLLASHGYRPEGDPRGADAGTARLDRFAGRGWLAAGDAALSFDPLSSQGMLNALYLGLKAGQAVAQALSGEAGLIDDYVRQAGSIWTAYQTNRKTYYATETRWRERAFWQRRAAPN
jgi:flavin-dependent dehydrogenase